MNKKEKQFTKEFLVEVLKVKDIEQSFNEKSALEHYKNTILREKLMFEIQVEGQSRLVSGAVFNLDALKVRIAQINSELIVIEERLKKL